MKILLGHVNVKLVRADIFKLIIGNDSLNQESNDNDIRIVRFATLKNLVVKITMFPNRKFHKS